MRRPLYSPARACPARGRSVTSILIIKTGALGDVLRTTSILPGLRERQPEARISWVTAPAARELVAAHPLVAETILLDPDSPQECERLRRKLEAREWSWILSLDDEAALCALARALPSERLSGATLDEQGRRCYTPDVAPWFDMGLLSTFGKQRADRLKVENRRSHPEIFAAMFGVRMGRPELPLSAEALARGEEFARRAGFERERPVIGLNTGAGGRWRSKGLPIEVVLRLVERLSRERAGQLDFVLLGGPDERERNRELKARIEGLACAARLVDAGTDNSIPVFAAIVSRCDLLLSSDSLALHIAIAREVPVVAFFAPTSAAEIHLYERGEAVLSSAPDYCSYRPDADNSSLTDERLGAAVARVLDATWGRDRPHEEAPA